MRLSTVREFRDRATRFLRSKAPVLVTRGPSGGHLFPHPEITLPLELKRELFGMLCADIKRQLQRRRVSEKEILGDFEAWRKKRRALVADANVLLSAVLGGRASIALTHALVEQVFTPAVTLAEVQEYAAPLARKKRLPLDVLLLSLAALPVTVVDLPEYARKLPEATRRLGQRDPDDVDVLALALHLRVPVWSNDDDFRESGVEWLTTATLLKRLGVR